MPRKVLRLNLSTAPRKTQHRPSSTTDGSGVRVPHNPLTNVSETDLLLLKVERLGEYESVGHSKWRVSKNDC
jgi:hypothetical protein